MIRPVILLVEDEPEVAAILIRSLASEDYHVLAAASGEEAMERVREHGGEIDLLVTDIVMPGMGGRELAWRLKEIYPRIGIILLSGYADSDGAMQMFDSHRSLFLEKPVEMRVFREHVRNAIADRA